MTAWGWCPSILRPMPLDDGLMVRIRLWMDRLSPDQAQGLADLAERYGAGIIELTSRANLQLRGLSEAEHMSLLPELDRLGLSQIDRTASGRVNVTLNPIRRLVGEDQSAQVAHLLSTLLGHKDYAALPEKFGFVVDTSPVRRLAEVPGDVRIEASGARLIVRADGAALGVPVDSADAAVKRAVEVAHWFLENGGVGPDGRGRMDALTARMPLPASLRGTVQPNPVVETTTDGPAWLRAGPQGLTPQALRAALGPDIAELRLTPFRAFYLPGRDPLASAAPAWNTAPQPTDQTGA